MKMIAVHWNNNFITVAQKLFYFTVECLLARKYQLAFAALFLVFPRIHARAANAAFPNLLRALFAEC